MLIRIVLWILIVMLVFDLATDFTEDCYMGKDWTVDRARFVGLDRRIVLCILLVLLVLLLH
jgi:hypothetical protein